MGDNTDAASSVHFSDAFRRHLDNCCLLQCLVCATPTCTFLPKRGGDFLMPIEQICLEDDCLLPLFSKVHRSTIVTKLPENKNAVADQTIFVGF